MYTTLTVNKQDDKNAIEVNYDNTFLNLITH